MSKILLESDFLTVDLRTLFNGSQNTEPERSTEPSTESNVNTPTSDEAVINSNADDWEERLAGPEFNFRPEVIEKLKALGEPFKKALRVLGFNTANENGGNPILAFVKQSYVQDELLLPGLLNALTFKAVYNAVAKKLVADSEFFNTCTYNIIYCKDLYKKSPAEIEKYLELQSTILKINVANYSKADQNKNKIVFLQTQTDKVVNELNPKKRAAIIKTETNELTTPFNDTKEVYGATLNSLELARLIFGKATNDTTSLSKEKQNELVKKLTTDSDKYAAILVLNLTADSSAAKVALNKFDGVQPKDTLNSFMRLITNKIIPKGQLNTTDADELVAKIMASRPH